MKMLWIFERRAVGGGGFVLPILQCGYKIEGAASLVSNDL